MNLNDRFNDLLSGFASDHHLNQEANDAVLYYPALMYTLARCLLSQYILEIGIYQGFTSYYLGRAAKLAGGHYYGVDINPGFCAIVRNGLTGKGIPNTVLCANSKEIANPQDLQARLGFPRIDFAFLDGEHNAEALLHEVELIYPHLPVVNGMICLHDTAHACSGALAKLEEDNRFEVLTLPFNNALSLLRKIEGSQTTKQTAGIVGLEKLGCQLGETVEEMEKRHAKGDFFTDYVNSIEHDNQMKKEHPEMANFPDFDRVKEHRRRYPG